MKRIIFLMFGIFILAYGCNDGILPADSALENGALKKAEVKMVPVKGEIFNHFYEEHPDYGTMSGFISHIGKLNETESTWESVDDGDGNPLTVTKNIVICAANGDKLTGRWEAKHINQTEVEGIMYFEGGTGRFENASGQTTASGYMVFDGGQLIGMYLAGEGEISNVGSSKDNDESPYPEDEEISSIITDAYIYGYPLVLMKITADRATNVVQTTDRGFAPFNQFSHRHTIPDYNFTSVVSPNTDTFYSSAWLDLDEEPMVLYIPDATLYAPEGEPWRYYLVQLMDAWSNVFEAPGVRTTTACANTFLITGPKWKGKVPGGMIHYASPTRLVWILGRTMVEDSGDAAKVIDFQNGISLMPLSAWPGPYSPPNGETNSSVDMVTAPVDQVANLPVEAFFQVLCDLMVDNPAASVDDAIIAEMEKLDIAPGAKFDLTKFTSSQQEAISAGYANGKVKLENLVNTVQRIYKNGWSYKLDDMGAYGDKYNIRAYVALVGLGANLAEDGVYPITSFDNSSNPLNSSNQYTITFSEGQTPPAKGFWSITMYNADHFLVQNPIDRYAIGSYSEYELNSDGSLTLYIQKDSPGIDKTSNWLPAPQTDDSSFSLMMRIYWPEESVLNDQWDIPAVVKAN